LSCWVVEGLFVAVCLSLCAFVGYWNIVICLSLAIVLYVLLLYTASDYPFGIFWPLCCLSFFYIRLLITPLVSSNFSYTHQLGETSMLLLTGSEDNSCFVDPRIELLPEAEAVRGSNKTAVVRGTSL
jgi:hypothetical protein